MKSSFQEGSVLMSRLLCITRRVIGVSLLALILFTTIAMSMFTPVGATAHALTSLPNDTVPLLIQRSQVVGSTETRQPVSLSIVLSLRQTTLLHEYVQAVSTPGSAFYHRYLQPAQFDALYAPTQQDVQRVTAYVQAQGLHVTRTNADVLDATGTVGTVEQAFHTQIKTYRAPDGRSFYANANAPLVPSALRPLIQSIAGLSDALQRQHPPVRTSLLMRGQTIATSHAVSCPGTGSNYYTPSQLATGYDFTGLYNAGYHGEGQSVALFELDSFVPTDIAGYQVCFDANAPTHINPVLVEGTPMTPGNGALEANLDAEIVLGMLPKLSNLYVYEAPNTDAGYNDEWARILSDDVPVVSTSWGACEASISGTDIAAEQQFFLQAAAQGQTIIAASGDSAAYDCGDGTLAVDDPASNPYVTGVGGTSLTLNQDTTYHSESAWYNTPSAGYGSGGGVSQLWSMPTYQSGTGVVSNQSSGSPCHAASGAYCREVPDVSMNADPNTGYIVYCTVAAASCQPTSPFVRVGGTSAAAPMWAAIATLANQYILAHGGNNIGFLNPTLYALLNSSSYSHASHDVTTGANGSYSATTGYDMVTGIGSADAYNFVSSVVSFTNERASVPANRMWYFAEGHVGSHFQEYLTLENPNVSSDAHVTISYLLHGKSSVSQSLTLNSSSRTTVNVNNVLNVSWLSSVGQDVSIVLSSDIPIVAERPIYFSFGGVTPGGSDIMGATQLGQHFTFANGSTVAGYSTFLSILNPTGQATATVTATYYSNGAQIGQTTISVPAGQRNTIPLGSVLPVGKQFLIQVDSDQPVAVERPLYFHTTVTGIPGIIKGGSSVEGVIPTNDWYFPDGSTGSVGAPSQESLILANPDANGSGSVATVTILYSLSHGSAKTVTVTVPPKSQLIRSVNADIGSGNLVSMQVHVTNGVSIVAERLQYFSFPSLTPNPTGIEVVGTTPGTQGLSTIYSFAEGHLGSSFSEIITLFNPNSSAIHVALTYFITSDTRQYIAQQQLTINAMGATQVNVNNVLNVSNAATTASGAAEDVSLVVQSLPNNGGTALPFVTERSLYFNFVGSMMGETSVVGYSG